MNKNLHTAITDAATALENQISNTRCIIEADPIKYPVTGPVYAITMAALEDQNQQVDLIRGWLKRNPPSS